MGIKACLGNGLRQAKWKIKYFPKLLILCRWLNPHKMEVL
jgi:hypothetical protein